MPYSIEKAPNGFFVVDNKGHKFSKKPITKKMAEKQRIAIAISEHKKTGKPMNKFFD